MIFKKTGFNVEKKGSEKGLTCLIDEPEPTTLNQIDLQKYLNKR
jgi:hypothetical protein